MNTSVLFFYVPSKGVLHTKNKKCKDKDENNYVNSIFKLRYGIQKTNVQMYHNIL